LRGRCQGGIGVSCWWDWEEICGKLVGFVLRFWVADFIYQASYIVRMEPLNRQEREARDKAFRELMGETGPGCGIGRKMMQARMRARLTQAELARRMGTTQPAIARFEAGRCLPSLRMLERLAEATVCRLVVRLEKQGIGNRE
jgi:DNA-binding XRE family transcriptional regulator